MNRRSLLATVGVSLSLPLSLSLGGCLDGTLHTDAGTEPTYDECDADIVRTDYLPEPARREVTASLEDGYFETDDELVLEAVMETDEAYLRRGDDYYEPVVETTGEGTRLELEETLPEATPIRIDNRTEERQTVTLRVEHEGDRFLEDEFELEAGEGGSVGEDGSVGEGGAFRFGRYHATVETEAKAETETETMSRLRNWRLNEQYPSVELAVTDTNIELVKAVVEPYYCNWDESGRL
ncbi:hypothetical protein [Halomontanus rarus]|uniref:hypothetical protein n=1 Tax=Halomontanus rarus TaxID=3034020 RepID=UPI0023E815E0|nr:hypothetical protein [Halovivax sp. TS33]